MQKERPILFGTPMVQSILQKRKLQTRRLVKGLPANASDELVQIMVSGFHVDYGNVICPYGKPGDILWVREAHLYYSDENAEGAILYKSDQHAEEFAAGLFEDFKPKWKPSIHMPKEAARIWLKVKSIRVERLQDISEEDAIAEGIEHTTRFRGMSADLYMNYIDKKFMFSSPGMSFSSLWISINGSNSWQANPWVWVVEFEVLSTTGKPAHL